MFAVTIPLRNPDPLSKWEGAPERPLRPHERVAYEFGGELLCSGCDAPMSLGTCGCCETPDGLDADAYLAMLDKASLVNRAWEAERAAMNGVRKEMRA